MMSEPLGQAFTWLLMFASAPCAATPGVSVLPSSVMSGPPFPLLSALVQSVTRFAHGIQSTTTLVLAYCGNCLWNCVTTPFIQVTWDATDGPIRHTVSLAGAARGGDPELGPPPPPPAGGPGRRRAAPPATRGAWRAPPRAKTMSCPPRRSPRRRPRRARRQRRSLLPI